MEILIAIAVVLVLLAPVAALFLWLMGVLCYALCELIEGTGPESK